MSYREALSQNIIAVSVSDSADMGALGLSEDHLKDAMAEVARHLLAIGARLAYGGDLRPDGFTELLFELAARHRRGADEGDQRKSILNFLAWPVHIQMAAHELRSYADQMSQVGQLIPLGLNGRPIAWGERATMAPAQPTEKEWQIGLTAMRETAQAACEARIVVGGQVEGFKGALPGIAEEVLLSLQRQQPIYILGGFGGCARDITETLGLLSPSDCGTSRWEGRDAFSEFSADSLANGLSFEENSVLARTPHIDQAAALMLRGLLNCLKPH